MRSASVMGAMATGTARSSQASRCTARWKPRLPPEHHCAPPGGWLSIRVLNEDLLFPDELLWETALLDALRRAAEAGARIVNLSLGDPRRPYRPPRPTVLAAAVDDLARRLDLVVVISAGNYPLAQHSRAEQ